MYILMYFDEFMRILYSSGSNILNMKRKYLYLTKSVINSFFFKIELFQNKRLIYSLIIYGNIVLL